MLKWIIALASVALLVGASPAMADDIVNTFRGTVVASDNAGDVTTNDVLNYFTGGNLIGAPFTLTFTLDSTIVDPGNPSFVDGGTFYGFPSNPISAALTIDGTSLDIADSSDAYYGDGGYGANEKNLQSFVFTNQLQTPGVTVDLTTTADTSTDLTTQLPTMLLSNDDFVNNFAGFYSSNGTDNEFLTLGVQAVNSPVPEPGTMSLLGTGLACIVGRKFKAKRNLRSSVK